MNNSILGHLGNGNSTRVKADPVLERVKQAIGNANQAKLPEADTKRCYHLAVRAAQFHNENTEPWTVQEILEREG